MFKTMKILVVLFVALGAVGQSRGIMTPAAGDVAESQSEQLLNQLWTVVPLDRPVSMTATVDVQYHDRLQVPDRQLRYELTLDGERFSMRLSMPDDAGPDGWTERLSLGWDGHTGWRLDAKQSMLTLWSAPVGQQPGMLPNPLYLPLAFLDPDFMTPGNQMTPRILHDQLMRSETRDAIVADDSDRLIVPMLSEATDRIATAKLSGDEAAHRLDGAYFRLSPRPGSNDYPLELLELLDSNDSLILSVQFAGQKEAYFADDRIVWPELIAMTQYENDEPVIVVRYHIDSVLHDPVLPDACSPNFVGVSLVVDGDLPPPLVGTER